MSYIVSKNYQKSSVCKCSGASAVAHLASVWEQVWLLTWCVWSGTGSVAHLASVREQVRLLTWTVFGTGAVAHLNNSYEFSDDHCRKCFCSWMLSIRCVILAWKLQNAWCITAILVFFQCPIIPLFNISTSNTNS